MAMVGFGFHQKYEPIEEFHSPPIIPEDFAKDIAASVSSQASLEAMINGEDREKAANEAYDWYMAGVGYQKVWKNRRSDNED
jgi:hypothetical protein